MKEAFKHARFRGASLAMIETCNSIIERYQEQGLRLTLRQLYYQLVSRNVIKNEEKAYKGLGKLLSEARLAGLVDWSAIEDRVRVPRVAPEWSSIEDIARAAMRSFRLPRWEGQEYYVELWVEKDAISGVMSPLATECHVSLMVNRGYSSQSAMYDAASRLKAARANGQSGVILYLGDLDPSGEDMVRDIRDRLTLMEAEVYVEKLALIPAQVQTYSPPPNPAKLSDSRADAYIKQHGKYSWEVDALPPEVLQDVARTGIFRYLDTEKMDAVKAREESDKARLRGALASLT